MSRPTLYVNFFIYLDFSRSRKLGENLAVSDVERVRFLVRSLTAERFRNSGNITCLHGRNGFRLMESHNPITYRWWKQDQNVKTKTKIKTKTTRSRPRPRPIKQQQDYITKKLFCCNTHVCYQKITLCKKRQKVYDDQLHLALFLHLLHEKNTGVY